LHKIPDEEHFVKTCADEKQPRLCIRIEFHSSLLRLDIKQGYANKEVIVF